MCVYTDDRMAERMAVWYNGKNVLFGTIQVQVQDTQENNGIINKEYIYIKNAYYKVVYETFHAEK